MKIRNHKNETILNRSKTFILQKTFSILTIVIMSWSCTQEAAMPTLEPAVSNNITGTIVNQSNQPIAGAEIKSGNETTTTAANGTFSINGAPNSDGFVYLTATKPGFIEGSKTFAFTTNTTFNIKIMLVSNTVIETINTGVETTVTLQNGTKVYFPKFYVDQNGNAYNGQVTVSIFHVLPSNADKKFIYYGMTVKNNTVVSEKKYRVYGMVIIEMKGSAGQLLDILNVKTLKVSFALENSQLASTPTNGQLLDFDDVSGYLYPSGQVSLELDANGVASPNRVVGTTMTKANRYNSSRSNRKGGIIFVGREEDNLDINQENAITLVKK